MFHPESHYIIISYKSLSRFQPEFFGCINSSMMRLESVLFHSTRQIHFFIELKSRRLHAGQTFDGIFLMPSVTGMSVPDEKPPGTNMNDLSQVCVALRVKYFPATKQKKHVAKLHPNVRTKTNLRLVSSDCIRAVRIRFIIRTNCLCWQRSEVFWYTLWACSAQSCWQDHVASGYWILDSHWRV